MPYILGGDSGIRKRNQRLSRHKNDKEDLSRVAIPRQAEQRSRESGRFESGQQTKLIA